MNSRLTLICELSERDKHRKKQGLFLCECGNKFVMAITKFRTGKTLSCGCLMREIVSKRMRSHGMSKSPEYKIWKGINKRCYSNVSSDYKNYGGRGINVCKEWRENFLNFYNDMGPRPSKKHSIHRLDNDGDYCKDNCKWATSYEQANEKRNNIKITYKGITKNRTEWERELDFPPGTLNRRMHAGWSIEKSFETPVKTSKPRIITYNNKTQTLSEWAREIGISIQCLYKRIDDYGWPLDRALQK